VKYRVLFPGGKRTPGCGSGVERCFPTVGQEFAQVDGSFGGGAQEAVTQVGEGVDAVTFGALDEAVVVGRGAASSVAAQEEPVLAFMLSSA